MIIAWLLRRIADETVPAGRTDLTGSAAVPAQEIATDGILSEREMKKKQP